jgi:hypothetical protein
MMGIEAKTMLLDEGFNTRQRRRWARRTVDKWKAATDAATVRAERKTALRKRKADKRRSGATKRKPVNIYTAPEKKKRIGARHAMQRRIIKKEIVDGREVSYHATKGFRSNRP